jgi:tetratricopeptide (TPR) repeat protein
MANRPTDHLFSLIRSLSKSEKRHFRLFVNRSGTSVDSKFVQLFDILDKQSEYDEGQIFRKAPGIKRAQLSNLKAHLYKQLMTSLRMNQLNQDPILQVRELMDQARVLYRKGLYQQSKRILDRAKNQAQNCHHIQLELEIVEFQKHIESYHASANWSERMSFLQIESDRINRLASSASRLSSLSLQMFGWFLQSGHIRNKEEYQKVQQFFATRLPEHQEEELTFFEKVYLYQSYLWYYFILLDFPRGYRYAQKWVSLFEEEPHLKAVYPDLYSKSLHHLLSILFNLLQHDRFAQVLEQLRSFLNDAQIRLTDSDTSNMTAYLITHRINQHFMHGAFTEGVQLIPAIEAQLKILEGKVDENRITLIHYKIACLYFGSGDNPNAIRYLNRIINSPKSTVRTDLHCFARILNLIAHFELGNDVLVDYQIRSVYRFLIKMDSLQEVQREIFHFLKSLRRIDRSQLQQAFIELKAKLEVLARDPYLSRPFLYLDIISWLSSKIEGQPVELVIRKNFGKPDLPMNNSL